MDRRQDIINKLDGFCEGEMTMITYPVEEVKRAMDEYMKECALELLDFVIKNMQGCSVSEDGIVEIKYNGQWLSKEKLFENFL